MDGLTEQEKIAGFQDIVQVSRDKVVNLSNEITVFLLLLFLLFLQILLLRFGLLSLSQSNGGLRARRSFAGHRSTRRHTFLLVSGRPSRGAFRNRRRLRRANHRRRIALSCPFALLAPALGLEADAQTVLEHELRDDRLTAHERARVDEDVPLERERAYGGAEEHHDDPYPRSNVAVCAMAASLEVALTHVRYGIQMENGDFFTLGYDTRRWGRRRGTPPGRI